MKNKLLGILITLFAVTHVTAKELSTPQSLAPLPQQVQAAYLSTQVLTRYPYKKVALDDAMSEKIFDRYLKLLDPEKLFFIQADIDQLTSMRNKIDDAIPQGNLEIPFSIFNLYERRFAERIAFAQTVVKQGFNFQQKENYEYAREKAPWSKSNEEVQDIWRKRVKNDWLRLKLAGKDEKSIRETLNKRYANLLNRIHKYKSEDVFQTFMNAYATSIDPHTNYFGPKASEEFDIAMKLSLVGIGASLEEKEEYTTIRALIPGGPAALSGKLNIGDRIVGVGQGENSVPTDVVGWRLDDVVSLIRGAKDTVVVLDILPAQTGGDEKHKLIALTRNKISLEEQAAKKSIIRVKEGDITHRVGVISIPTFYQDFQARSSGEKNFKSVARDVSVLLEELKKENVESVLVDLRNNSGGSLEEVIELTGLFIDKGPVVQVRNALGKVKVDSDTKAGSAWQGPLGVLINRSSASASEIFAAAIQDYGRGIVMGEPSFGKGTVQTVIDLDDLARNEKPQFGEVKVTIAQFFRINGGTTQLRGVTPDINFPTLVNMEDFGESSFENALPWTRIDSTNYTPAGNVQDLIPKLKSRYDSRLKNDDDLRQLVQDINEIKQEQAKKLISLNEVDRRKERQAQEAKIKSREKHTAENLANDNATVENSEVVTVKNPIRQDDGLQANERSLSAELESEKVRKNIKDVILNEAVHVLNDAVELIQSQPAIAKGAVPSSTSTSQ